MKSNNNQNEYLTQGDLVLFGTGEGSNLLYALCKKNAIAITCFCDNNQEIQNTTKNDLPILSLESIKKTYENPIFLLSVFEDTHKKQIKEQLKSAGYHTFYTFREFIDTLPLQTVADPFVQIRINEFKMAEYRSADSPLVYAEFIDLWITEKCSLRCRDCGYFMQYHKNPKHYDTKDIFAEIDRLDELFDFVGSLHIVGGEPFVHPDIYEIIAYAQTKKTFQSVGLVTNGTIAPKKDELLKLDYKNILFWVSNYGDLSIKRNDFITLSKELSIPIDLMPRDLWYKQDVIQFRNKTETELAFAYETCTTFCVATFGQKIFRCGFIGNMYRLNSLPHDQLDYLDISNNGKSIDLIKKEIKQYLYGKPFYTSCNWCVGRITSELAEIPSAIQTKETLSYKKYDT